MKFTIDIDSEEKTLSRAIFEVYLDVKKKRVDKNSNSCYNDKDRV